MNTSLKDQNSFTNNVARIPQKNRTPNLTADLERFKQFDSNILTQDELNDYFDFCSIIYPNEENELGLLFKEEINKEKALSFLHKNKYDIIKTKFLLAFPIMDKYCKEKNLQLSYTEEEMIDLLEEFQKKKSNDQNSKEKLFFKEIIRNFEYGDKQLEFEEVKLIFENALRRRFKIPIWIGEEFQKCREFSLKITEVLEKNQKNLIEIDNLIKESSYYKIIPDNLNSLKVTKNKIDDFLKRVEYFLSCQEKDIMNMNELMSELQSLKIDIEQNVYLQTFNKFYHQTENIFTRIHQIQKPNQNIEKISMETLCKIMYFFTENNIKQNQKFLELIIFVKKMECIKEKCLMWVEDNRDKNPNNIMDFLGELKNCSIDYSRDINLIHLKLETLNLLQKLLNNFNNEKELYKNLMMITEYENQKIKFFEDEIIEYKKILIAIRKVDDKIEKINSMNCSIEDFLFDKPYLMPIKELELSLQDPELINRKNEYLTKVYNFIDQFKAYLNSVMNFKSLSNVDLYEKIRQILEFALSSEPLMSNIKEEMLKRIKMEYYLIMFFEKFAFKKFPYPFQQFEVYFKNNFRDFNTITEGLNFFKLNESYLIGLSVYDYYKWFSNNYKTIKRLLTEGPKPEEAILNLTDIEKILKENFNDQELLDLFNSKKEVNHQSYLSSPYETNRHTKFLLLENHEKIISDIKNDKKQCKLFYEENIEELKKIYFETKKIEIAISSEKMEEIENLLKNKFQLNSDSSIDSFFNRISDIIFIKNSYEKIYFECNNIYDEEIHEYILKVPIYIIIFYKLRILGIQTDFIEIIENLLDNYFILDETLDLKEKLTIKDLKRIYKNIKNNNLYNPKKYFINNLLSLAENFIDSSLYLENHCRKGHICSKEILNKFNKKIDIKNYNIELKNDNEIRLKKRGLEIFKNQNFKNFLAKNRNNEKIEHPEKRRSNRLKIIPWRKPDKNRILCLCQNYFKFSESKFFKYINCNVKFHKSCINLKDGREISEDLKCPSCEFLDSDLNSKSDYFIERKIPEVKFLVIFKAYSYLKEYIIDTKLDFIVNIIDKIDWIVNKLELIKIELSENKLDKIRNKIHKISLIYLYIPVRFLEIEKCIFKILEKI